MLEYHLLYGKHFYVRKIK